MSAYVIVQNDAQNAELYEAYKVEAPASVAIYGGRYLSRGGDAKCCSVNGQQPARQF
jgi:uncharacterized protein (DUF1330 family)